MSADRRAVAVHTVGRRELGNGSVGALAPMAWPLGQRTMAQATTDGASHFGQNTALARDKRGNGRDPLYNAISVSPFHQPTSRLRLTSPGHPTLMEQRKPKSLCVRQGSLVLASAAQAFVLFMSIAGWTAYSDALAKGQRTDDILAWTLVGAVPWTGLGAVVGLVSFFLLQRFGSVEDDDCQ